MTILYSENFMGNPTWPFAVLFMVLTWVCIIWGSYIIYKNDSFELVPFALAFAFATLSMTCCNCDPFAKTQTIYYATIDDASLSEVLEDYDIVEQKGSLFILEEKEN